MKYCYLLTTGLIFKTDKLLVFTSRDNYCIPQDGKIFVLENKFHSDAIKMSFQQKHVIATWECPTC